MEALEKFSYIPKIERRFDLDWLRMISIVLLFFIIVHWFLEQKVTKKKSLTRFFKKKKTINDEPVSEKWFRDKLWKRKRKWFFQDLKIQLIKIIKERNEGKRSKNKLSTAEFRNLMVFFLENKPNWFLLFTKINGFLYKYRLPIVLCEL